MTLDKEGRKLSLQKLSLNAFGKAVSQPKCIKKVAIQKILAELSFQYIIYDTWKPIGPTNMKFKYLCFDKATIRALDNNH